MSSENMDYAIGFSFFSGLIIWGILFVILTFRERRTRIEVWERLRSEKDVQDRFYPFVVMNYRYALKALEAGDLERAKTELSVAMADFYHHFEKCSQSDELIAMERREIELHAKSSVALATALSKKPDGNSIVAEFLRKSKEEQSK